MEYVYVLWSEKLKKRYVGSTTDVEHRVAEHNTGQSEFTRRGIPWMLVYWEELLTRSEARKRERFLKSGVGRKWLDETLPKYRRGA